MSSEDNTKEWFRRRFWNILAQDFYCLTELQDANCKIYLFMPKHSRDTDKNIPTQCAELDNQDNDAHLGWVIAMSVQ